MIYILILFQLISDFDIFTQLLSFLDRHGTWCKSADVWDKFEKSRKKEIRDGGQCARSGTQGIPERLKTHVESCESDIPKKIPKPAVTITIFVSSTTMTEKEKIDEALAEFFTLRIHHVNEWNTEVLLKSFCKFFGQVMFLLTEEN